ncbi:SEFIR domain-containing protein [Methylomonas sp. UP202]|uniref:SEFIR domain-containing protein n=1 Tax=Methylomonas sp. UP202 TaxID=3040943 RepID=UPI0024788D72|nr:SEFIR domain-containing protein [Methylomonas sp. UP202]WGS88164.1 TIR domain-containing protein [Methylomonas sp. UP202]
MDQQTAPKVFISYSHDSPGHAADVLALANQLCEEGIDCEIDQYLNGAPADGWIRWMERQIAWADFVLVICTETYLTRFKGDDRLGGRGVNIEGLLISQTLYDQFQNNIKFLPLIPDNGSIDHVPLMLKGGTTYRIQADYLNLYRVLTDQPEVEMPPLGPRVVLAPQNDLPNDSVRMIAPENETTRRMSGFGRDPDRSDTGSADDSQRQNGQPPKADRIREAAQANNHSAPHQRQALIDLLTEQLQRHDLQSLVADYVARINKGFKTSFSDADTSQCWKDFAAYLVNQADDEGRRLQVLHFLDALLANDGVQNVEMLLGYLLHILIRNDQIDRHRINHMPFECPATLDLLTASRNHQALIPDYTETEFTNGLKKHGIFHSDYQPQIGVWEEERVSREIAKQILASINGLRADSKDPLSELGDFLSAYDTERRYQPIKAIRIHQNAFNQHPLSDSDIARYFLQKIGPGLPIYVYGAETEGNASDYLHTDENKIGAVVERYRRESGSKITPTPPRETNMSNPANPINVTVVNASPGTIIGDHNSQVIDNSTKQALTDELANLKTIADQDDSIGKKHYAEIAAAADAVKSEIAKPQANKTVLAAAAKTLEGFKNIASITGSIEKISQILIPLLS